MVEETEIEKKIREQVIGELAENNVDSGKWETWSWNQKLSYIVGMIFIIVLTLFCSLPAFAIVFLFM